MSKILVFVSFCIVVLSYAAAQESPILRFKSSESSEIHLIGSKNPAHEEDSNENRQERPVIRAKRQSCGGVSC